MTDLIGTPAERTAHKEVFAQEDAVAKPLAQLPPGFAMRDDGLYVEGKDAEVRIAGRFWILSRSRDFDNENHAIELEFDDDDEKRHPISIRRSDLQARPQKVIERMIRAGYYVDLDACDRVAEALYGATINKTSRTTSRIGWQAEQVFVLPHMAFGCNAEPVKLDEVLTCESGFGLSGTIDAWKKTASLAIGNSILLFAGSVAFTGPLLDVVAHDSTLFHLRGASSIGKTTAGRFAASVWGRPSITGGFMSTWKATINGLELLSAGRRDTLPLLDELSMATPKEVAAAVYMIASGSGKARMSPDLTKAKVQKWRNAVLSTGEISLSSYLQSAAVRTTGGQSVRFIDIPADAKQRLGLFQTLHDAPHAAELARRISTNLDHNFGHAGPAFVEQLISYPDRCKAQIEALARAFEAKNCPPDADGQIRRVCNQFALVAAAGDLASRFQIAPWSQEDALAAAEFCFASWLSERGHTGSHEIAQAISHLRAEMHRNESTAIGSWLDDDKPQPKVGYKRTVPESLSGYYIPYWKMHDLLSGYDMKAVLEALKQNGRLRSDPGRLTKQARDPVTGANRRFYCLTPEFLDDPEEGHNSSKACNP